MWWRLAADTVGDWWQGTAKAVVSLAVLMAPALWLLNVRFALVSLVELPDKLGEIARRRGGQLRGRPAERPKGGLLEAIRTVRDLVRDYGDVTGSWGVVAQLVAPTFWVFTGAALVAVPVLVIAAVVVAIVG